MTIPNSHNDIIYHQNAAEIALQLPISNFKDGLGCVGPYGQFVDKDSFLKYNSLQTQNGSKINLPHVGFLTVPYMGRGPGNMLLESQLTPGEDTSSGRACNTLSGVTIPHYFTPLVPHLDHNIQIQFLIFLV